MRTFRGAGLAALIKCCDSCAISRASTLLAPRPCAPHAPPLARISLDNSSEEEEEEEEEAEEEESQSEGEAAAPSGPTASRGHRRAHPVPCGDDSHSDVLRVDLVDGEEELSDGSGCVDQGPEVEKVLGRRTASDGRLEYCCLQAGASHRRVTWHSGAWLQAHCPAKLRGWRTRAEREDTACGVLLGEGESPVGKLFPASHVVVDRIFSERPGEGSQQEGASRQLLVKWQGLGYSQATWEGQESLTCQGDAMALTRYQAAQQPRASRRSRPLALPPTGLVAPPTFQAGCSLRNYQRVSFDWMLRNAAAGRNVILGDEMGLGKTAQSVAVLEHMRMHGTCASGGAAFLVIAPLTTLIHWQREVQKWTQMNAVVYDGSAADRAACRAHELFFPGSKRLKCDVLLTSYDTMRKEAGMLGRIHWAAVVADEAHRLKDAGSATATALRQAYRYDWLLMLTGTPVQNNLVELFGLLHLLDPEAFPSVQEFQEAYCTPEGAADARRMPALAAALRPYLLRRMKEDVEDIPEKEEVVVWVEMTVDQRAYYKGLHENKMHVLLAASSRKNMPSSRNLLMELRHCSNHPFLLKGVQDDFTRKRTEAAAAATPPLAPPSEADLLIAASGKMVLLGKLLPKLQSEGHKVLIFSQFKLVLDLLQDMCEHQSWHAERLDGDTSAAERQAGIDRFNTPGQGFIYLLSTRAGGMGITLTAADVAIIYDSDWNPQVDLQAMARCHRIGQTKQVRVYRLVTRGTYEESIIKTASRKFGLDEALLGGGGGEGGEGGADPLANVERIESLLKHGVLALSDSACAETARFMAEDIDDILAKRVERRQIGSRKGNTFSTATFVAEEEPPPPPEVADEGAAPAAEAAELSGAAFWAAALPEAMAREVAAPHKLREMLVEGPRHRKKVDYVNGGGAGAHYEEEEEEKGPGDRDGGEAYVDASPSGESGSDSDDFQKKADAPAKPKPKKEGTRSAQPLFPAPQPRVLGADKDFRLLPSDTSECDQPAAGCTDKPEGKKQRNHQPAKWYAEMRTLMGVQLQLPSDAALSAVCAGAGEGRVTVADAKKYVIKAQRRHTRKLAKEAAAALAARWEGADAQNAGAAGGESAAPVAPPSRPAAPVPCPPAPAPALAPPVKPKMQSAKQPGIATFFSPVPAKPAQPASQKRERAEVIDLTGEEEEEGGAASKRRAFSPPVAQPPSQLGGAGGWGGSLDLAAVREARLKALGGA